VTLLVDASDGSNVGFSYVSVQSVLTVVCAQVGGIQFVPKGCNAETHRNMVQHHRQVTKFKPVGRGMHLEVFAYGRMHPVGSCQAQGGRRGDTYTEYLELQGTSVEEIQTLFNYTYVSDSSYSLAWKII
jgi:hypothetical protein